MSASGLDWISDLTQGGEFVSDGVEKSGMSKLDYCNLRVLLIVRDVR